MLDKVNVIFSQEKLSAHRQEELANKQRATLIDGKLDQQTDCNSSVQRSKYQVLTHKKRLDILCLNKVHGFSIHQLSLMTGHHYATIRKIIEIYDRTGKTSIALNQVVTVSQEQHHVDVIDPVAQAEVLLNPHSDRYLDTVVEGAANQIFEDEIMDEGDLAFKLRLKREMRQAKQSKVLGAATNTLDDYQQKMLLINRSICPLMLVEKFDDAADSFGIQNNQLKLYPSKY